MCIQSKTLSFAEKYTTAVKYNNIQTLRCDSVGLSTLILFAQQQDPLWNSKTSLLKCLQDFWVLINFLKHYTKINGPSLIYVRQVISITG